MTYDNITVQRDSFPQIFSPYTRILILLLLLLSALFPALPLIAASLVYDQSDKGKLTGFDAGELGPELASSYENKTAQYRDKPGYLGRMVYVGGPTTFTFSDVRSPAATDGGVRGGFYFVNVDRNDRWREYFLVLRPWGFLHDTSLSVDKRSVDLIKKTTVLKDSGMTLTLSQGAGDELAEHGKKGYNYRGGVQGDCLIDANGNYNEFKYRYPYSHIWIDVTYIIRYNISTTHTWPGGIGHFYSSDLAITTSTGASLLLNLLGYYGADFAQPDEKPFTFNFNITKYYPSYVSYNTIRNCNSKETGLDIASISYLSINDKAKVTISSDPGGTSTEFYFVAKDGTGTTGQPSRFNLAFQSTIPAAAPVALSETNCFTSVIATEPSPISGSNTSNRLEGMIKLYTDRSTVTPLRGFYTSTIYLTIEPADTI